MAESLLTEFLVLLKKSGLLNPSQWSAAQEIAAALPPPVAANSTPPSTPPSTPSAFSTFTAEMVKRNWITQWQANQLQKGQTGFILQQYRLLMPVGKGGMGHVFQACDTRTDAVVAVKVMSKKLAGNQTLVNRFRREIRASLLLNSPHIVRTLDAGRVGKVDFMVMEYVNGDQVDRIVSRVPNIPVGMACDIVRQAAIGLQHAYEQKMVHRDLKPGNLIVHWSPDGTGTVKIMDMGLVRLGTEGDERTSVTKAGQVMGTPDYMSPEQGWDTATVDIRSDIYSLGCTLFRLLTGRVPFPGDNPLQVLMARCSRDAPSVRSLRSDIPEPVVAIVQKMTLRDPAARYQTPLELIEALTPFCSRLTTTALRTALQEAGEDDAILLEVAGTDDSAESQDAGYQQFLREMDSGAAVDLMTSSSGPLVNSPGITLPLIPDIPRAFRRTRPKSGTKKRQMAGLIAVASGITLASLVGLFVYVNRDTEPRAEDEVIQQVKSEIVLPKVMLRAAASISFTAGGLLEVAPEIDDPAGLLKTSDDLVFQKGKGAPAGVTIDAKTGQVRWEVPREQAPAVYSIPVELLFGKGKPFRLVSAVTLEVKIEASVPRYTFTVREPMSFLPGESVRVRVQAEPVPDTKSGLEYRLTNNLLPGMSLDSMTGQFTWTPSVEDAGRHDVSIVLVDSKTSQTLATGSLTLFVRPMLRMPTFPEQKAVAGSEFQLQLFDRPPRFPGRALRLVVKEGSPAGVTIDPRRATLTWRVPEDASGRYEIRVIAESLLPNLKLDAAEIPETVIVVNVTGMSPVTPATRVPSQADVATAMTELRELFKREINAARSAAERGMLARQMLDRAEDEQPSASDFALLDLVAELAEKGRAPDVGLDANWLRASRYGTEELPVAKELAGSIRVSTLSALQGDLLVEHLLRISLSAANEKNYADVAALLETPEQLLRKSENGSLAGQLSGDVTSIRKLALELAEDANDSVAGLKSGELVRLLQRWQFRSLFTNLGDLAFVSSSQSVADSGRSLWKFDANRIRLSTPAQPQENLGFLDQSMDVSRCLIRLQLSGDTTSAMLIFGAGRDQTLTSHLLTLDKSEFGRIVTVPGGTNAVAPATGLTIPVNRWNDVEILIDRTSIAVRLNGVPAMSAQLSSLTPGRLGMLVPLERTTPPNLDIRHPRLLILSDAP